MENGQLSHARVRPGGPSPLLLRTVHEHRPEAGDVSVLKARGTVDASNAADFSAALAGHIGHADDTGEHPVLDLTEVYLACSDAMRALERATAFLAVSGRVLPVVEPRPHVREALRTAGLPGVRVHATMASALNTPEPRPAQEPPGDTH
ncbi:STAS domain-containing protein [Streptomyces sp. 1222.5]|uniref:STAS domain-containing protein n=1 Tax=Streptomyces sp. 1222.5 TaxID=1881026 RepID=UPI003D73785C